MSTASAIETIEASLTSTDTKMKRLFDRLERDFTRLHHSDGSQNPYALLQRLREAQAQLPELRAEVAAARRSRSHAETLCRTDVAAAAAFALDCVPALPPHNAAAAAVRDETVAQLQNARDALHAALAPAATHAHAAQGARAAEAPGATASKTRAAPRARGPNGAAARGSGGSTGSARVSGASERRSNGAGRTGTARSSGDGQASGGGATAAAASDVGSGFQPVSKQAYNRLPRNIKVKGGKLEAVNELYAKVYKALSASGAPMSDAKLMAAVGESNKERLGVLRGLNLISNRKDGWMLL